MRGELEAGRPAPPGESCDAGVAWPSLKPSAVRRWPVLLLGLLPATLKSPRSGGAELSRCKCCGCCSCGCCCVSSKLTCGGALVRRAKLTGMPRSITCCGACCGCSGCVEAAKGWAGAAVSKPNQAAVVAAVAAAAAERGRCGGLRAAAARTARPRAPEEEAGRGCARRGGIE